MKSDDIKTGERLYRLVSLLENIPDSPANAIQEILTIKIDGLSKIKQKQGEIMILEVH